MIANGMTVKFHYRLSVDGEIVDDSHTRPPVSFIHGNGMVIRGLELATLGMKPGETKEVDVAPENGYGVREESRVKSLPITDFRQPERLKPGTRIGGKDKGRPFQGTVLEVTDDAVKVDMNHPYAGRELHFEIEILEVDDGPPKRIPYQRRKKG
ncbi:MAG: peptidylprolyl isomerase [Planctomycetota bacterium]